MFFHPVGWCPTVFFVAIPVAGDSRTADEAAKHFASGFVWGQAMQSCARRRDYARSNAMAQTNDGKKRVYVHGHNRGGSNVPTHYRTPPCKPKATPKPKR